MLYMIYIARGEHATAHYAICTGFMALGLMLPGMWSGWLQEHARLSALFCLGDSGDDSQFHRRGAHPAGCGIRETERGSSG